MCGMCPDFVEWCGEGDCYHPEAVRQKKRHFFLGDIMCEHLTEKYGTSSASLLDHVRREHYWEEEDWEEPKDDPLWCDEGCIGNGWFTQVEIEAVYEALRKEEQS